MSDAVLIYADTQRSPAMRHELPLGIGDPFLYLETNGKRLCVTNALEADRLAAAAPDVEQLMQEQLGRDELLQAGTGHAEIERILCERACARLGIRAALVPDEFPLALADHLRAAGVELRADGEHFRERRRVKTAAQLAGIERAQRAAEAGMAAAAALLREATPDGELRTRTGAVLTAEDVRAAIRTACAAHGAPAPPDIIVGCGELSAAGHESGHGPLRASEPIVIDLWPCDEASGCFADMTRTFVVGAVPDDVAAMHALSHEALTRSVAAMAADVPAAQPWEIACDVFEAAGHPTRRSKAPGTTLTHGFYFSLGHGVGLDVHEAPTLGPAGAGMTLRAGEVFAVEPGTSDERGWGARLEDLVLVGEDGARTLTRYPYALAP